MTVGKTFLFAASLSFCAAFAMSALTAAPVRADVVMAAP